MEDKEIILNNLSQICITPEGNLGDANSWKKMTYKSDNDYIYYNHKKGSSIVKIDKREIDLYQFKGDDYQEIRQVLIQEIKNNPSQWKVVKEGELEVIKHRQTGRKHWTYTSIFTPKQDEKQWEEVRTLLQSRLETETNNIPWGKIALYGGGGIVVVFFLYLLIRKYFF